MDDKSIKRLTIAAVVFSSLGLSASILYQMDEQHNKTGSDIIFKDVLKPLNYEPPSHL